MPDSMHPLVAEMIANLDDNLRESFEERAAIIEFDAGLNRQHAECLALIDTFRRHPEALTRITAVEVAIRQGRRCLLTTDRTRLGRHLTDTGSTLVRTVDLASVVADRFDGVAALTEP